MPDDLRDFLETCSTFLDLDVDETWSLTTKMIRYYGGDQSVRADLRRFHELERRWYHSLDEGNPDYGVYADRCVLSDIYACWWIYSRKYLNSISAECDKIPGLSDIKSVVDVGCGVSLSTSRLREIFPDARVLCTNVVGSDQYKIAEKLGEKRGFTVSSSTVSMGHVDMVFASEYFEHFEDPISHLETILLDVSPRFLIVANSFGTISLGHFRSHRYRDGPLVPAPGYGRVFNARLRELGFKKVQTKCWNDRPTFWRRDDLYVTSRSHRLF